MGRLIYAAIASADGYVEDADGRFEWAAPDDELLGLVNELERTFGTHLYGRRMYETLVYWETAGLGPDDTELEGDFARVWRGADKVVFSTTLADVSSARTRIERAFSADLVRGLKDAADQDISVGGAGLAGQALGAGLVDELQLFLLPVIVGGGKPALPAGVRLTLELLETRRLAGGAVFLRYAVR